MAIQPNLSTFLSAEAVVTATVSGVVETPAPKRKDYMIPTLRLRVSDKIKGTPPKRVFLLFPKFRSIERLSERYPSRTQIVVAIEPVGAQMGFAPDGDPKYFVLAGNPCQGGKIHPLRSVKARAVILIFDGEGDTGAEVALFNKLFHYREH